MSDQEQANPFPGPQPYRTADRHRFFGRELLAKKLLHQVLAHPSTVLFGPSGAGKSSLMQAGVIPKLEETHGFRVVRVDGWPSGEAPLSWLVSALFADLDLGAPSLGERPIEALDAAMVLAERRSERPILIYLDQLEQLLFPGRDEAEAGALLDGALRLASRQGVQIVLSLREDYLGRFRDRTQDQKELVEHGFRLGPLSVGEMVKAVCRAAAEGTPAQTWSEEQILGLMLEVRTPGQRASEEAEVEAAFGQIVSRALWEERAAGNESGAGAGQAEAILHRYLEATVEDLGPLKDDARRLLEEHLIDPEGHRTVLTEKEARGVLRGVDAAEVLGRLERAAVLRAEEHQGSRYFELGHDWLAKKVFERRQEREREEAERTRQEELRRARAARRWYAVIAILAGMVAVGMALGVFWALEKQRAAEKAEGEAKTASQRAETNEARARMAALMAGARELLARNQPAPATRLLLEVKDPERARGWIDLAYESLSAGLPQATLRGHTGKVVSAVWSPDGQRIVTASYDNTARVWNADGKGDPLVLKGHEGSVTSAAWSPDGKRIVTASLDPAARVWNADGKGDPLVLKGHESSVFSAAWSPDGKRIVTASLDQTARVWNADGKGDPLVLKGHEHIVRSAAFSPDGQSIVTASDDKTARIWPLSIPALQQSLRSATTECLSPEQRRTYLDEREADARKEYEACERSAGRTPVSPDAMEP